MGITRFGCYFQCHHKIWFSPILKELGNLLQHVCLRCCNAMHLYLSHQGMHLPAVNLWYREPFQDKCNNPWLVCQECLLVRTWRPSVQRRKQAWLAWIPVIFQCREAPVGSLIRTRYFCFLSFIEGLLLLVEEGLRLLDWSFLICATVEKEGSWSRDGDAEPRVSSAEEAVLTPHPTPPWVLTVIMYIWCFKHVGYVS